MFLVYYQKNIVVNVNQEVPWGLDRIDQVDRRLDGEFNSLYDGSGVDLYIVDTGIQLNHEEFEGRAICGFSTSNDFCRDGVGHGTHVAGIAGGKTYGVAKKSKLVAVKVFENSETTTIDAIAAGVDYVIGQKMQKTNQAMVMNMSLGGTRRSSSQCWDCCRCISWE